MPSVMLHFHISLNPCFCCDVGLQHAPNNQRYFCRNRFLDTCCCHRRTVFQRSDRVSADDMSKLTERKCLMRWLQFPSQRPQQSRRLVCPSVSRQLSSGSCHQRHLFLVGVSEGLSTSGSCEGICTILDCLSRVETATVSAVLNCVRILLVITLTFLVYQ